MPTVELNQPVPNIQFVTNQGNFDLASLHGKRCVIYFYPKDNTPGCTKESIDFGCLYPEFKKLNTEILGISRDSLASHEKFATKYEFPFPLVSDTDEKICQLFGVMRHKLMFGKTIFGLIRSTFLIDEHGILRHEWRKVSVKNHVEEVLASIKALDSTRVTP